jgi:hypothetical protein
MKELPESGGFLVPDDFDTDAFVAVQKQTAKYDESAPVPRRAFAHAWNGVMHRFRNSHDWNLAFIDAMSAGDGPPLTARYAQEMALFGFTSAGVAAVDCCAFAAYCLGALARPDVFPVASDKDLKFYPPQVRDSFLAAYPQEAVGSVLSDALKSSDYTRITDLRNVLSHRGTLPRNFRVSVGSVARDADGAFIPSNPKSINSNWIINQRLDAHLTDSWRAWLGHAQARLMMAIKEFSAKHL